MKSWSVQRDRRAASALLTVGALAVALAACGSNSSSNSTAGASAGASSSGSSSGVGKAKAVVQPLLAATTTWRGPKSAPKPKPGIRVAVISCSQVTTGCARPTKAAVEAAKVIGWRPTVFDGQGEPSVQNQAVESAVSGHYQAIILMLVDPNNVSAGLNAAKAAHIAVVTLGEPDYTTSRGKTWRWIPDVSHDWLASGKAIGDYMIWKSNGKVNAFMMDGADTVVVQLGQFKGTYEELTNKAMCPDCKVSVNKFTVATLTTEPPAEATSAVQSNPSLNWLWCYDFCLYQAITKLQGAGLVHAGLQAAGFDCNAENLNFMKEGLVQTVCAADARDWEAWATIDEANRLVDDQPAVPENPPFRLFDKSTINQLTKQDLADGWQGGYDFRTKFKQLWGVS